MSETVRSRNKGSNGPSPKTSSRTSSINRSFSVRLSGVFSSFTSLEIEGRGGALLVPFTRACVPEVDVAGGKLVVVVPDVVEAPAEHAAGEAVAP